MGEIGPTADDLARDLLADLSELEGRDGRDYEAWVCDNVDHAWPAAIRRALAAEAEAARLNDTLALLSALMAAKQEELERLQAALNSLVLAAGSTIVTDGDTTCSLGWWATQVLEGGAR